MKQKNINVIKHDYKVCENKLNNQVHKKGKNNSITITLKYMHKITTIFRVLIKCAVNNNCNILINKDGWIIEELEILNKFNELQ